MSKSFDHLKKLSEWVVDDRVRLSVIGAGFGAFLDLSPPKHDHALLSSLVDHYDVSERCFVFNDVKLHFGLEDVWHITGLPVDGEVVTGVEGNSIQLSIEYLGENLCEDKRGAIKLSTLKNRFQNVPAEIDSRELTYYIRAYLLYVLGTVILPDKSGSMVPTIYLPLLEDIKKVHHYAWGAALLAHLHVALANCKKQGSQSIMGHTFSLLVFVLLRICKILRLSLRLGDGEREDLVSSINFPIAVGWSKVLSDHSRNNFNKATREDYSRILNGLQDDDITWQPYIGLQGLPLDGSRQQMVARSRTILICYEKAVYHRPDVAPKQFGYKSVVVADKMIDVKVRGRSGPKPKNQKGIDWGEKYSEYVSVWKRRTLPGCLIIEEEVGVLENAGGEASASVEATFSRGGDACQTDEQEEVGVLENAGGEASASVEATFSRGGDACQTDEQEEVVVLENAGWETSVEAMFSQGGDACRGGDDTFSQGGDACQTDEQDHTVDIQAETLRKISSSYDRDKKFWAMAVSNLEEKIKVMKEQHFQLSSEAHKCANSIPDWTIMISAIQSLVSQCEDLKVKYNEEHQERRKLYNQVQEAKGNIRVFCRCRPLSKTEVAAGHATVVDFDAAKDGELGILTGGSTKKFSFDRVYTPKDDQVDVFADASPMVISVLDGYNVCIFAYGQTGTGKTYTVEGTQHNRGINYRTLEELFKVSKCRSATFTFEISVSVLEVYNEQIRDLLATSPPSKKLEIKVDSEGFHHVPGVVEVKVEDTDEVWSVLQTGSSARAVGSNNVNEHSSRSHCMLCTMVKAKNLLSGECTKSRLWLVDLAGSERFAKTGFQSPNRRREAQNINKSLTHLGDVISALASKNTHIPYRNSKLTHLLQDSLGGHSKTLMFVQISPSEQDLKETLCSLNFATRVEGVELGPAKKQIDTSELRNLKMKVEELESKLKEKQHNSEPALHQKVEELERELKEKCDTESLLHQKVEELERKLKQKQDNSEQKIKELEDKLREISFQSEV